MTFRNHLYVLLLLLPCMQEVALAQGAGLPVADTALLSKNRNALLPAAFDLLSISGSGSSGQHIISWKTDSRSRFTGFTLEKSMDEKEFTPIGHISLSGVAKSNSFSYADNKPVTGRNFYRLQMTDSGGNKTYSAVVALTFTPATNLQIHFDSPSGTLGLTGMEPGSEYSLKVYSCNGQPVLQKTVTAAAASISIGQLPHGLYVVYAFSGSAAPVSRKIIW